MKKKIQKYLSGEREGFSLVELIIVIAIMAILIGVIALAIIPYLAKSKESKDLQALSSVNSALASAVADTKVSGSGDFEYTGTAVTNPTTDEQKVLNAMVALLGKGSTTLQSDNATTAKIRCKYDTATNTVMTYAGTAAGTAVLSEYNETGYGANLATTTAGKAFVVSN